MRRLSILIPILLLVSMTEAHVQLERVVDRRIVMGVECRITVYAPSEAEARAATRDAFVRMEAIERAISSWRPGSEASKFQQRVGEEVELTPEFFELLWRSLLWAKRSDGAFDPTFGALIATWRDARSQERVPSQDAIERAQDHSGWQHVELDLGRRSAKITKEGLQLDFGGIGKGFAADQALNVLRNHGLPSAIIEIGGDVVAGDPPPGTEGWRVEIEPASEEADSSRLLANGAMATSGDAEQFFEVDGKRYSHIINPKSGLALTSRVQVTAIVRGGVSPGADADALASAASVRVAEGGDLASLLEGIPGAELLVFNAEDLTVRSWGPTPAGAISGGRELKVLFDEAEFTEGPAATPTGVVYFTDQPNDRIMRIATDGEVTQFARPSFRANGLAIDEHGAIWACADNENQLVRFDSDGTSEVVLDEGIVHRFNGPNDLWIAPDSSIYFTDPFYSRQYWSEKEKRNHREEVYRLAPDHRSLTVAASDFVRPNGIVGTPDGKTLFVADINAGQTLVFAIQPDGTLIERRVFCEYGSDGMTLDSAGNLYLTGDGVRVFDPSGKLIEWIPIPERWTANICFGGEAQKTLFITAMSRVYAIEAAHRAAGY